MLPGGSGLCGYETVWAKSKEYMAVSDFTIAFSPFVNSTEWLLRDSSAINRLFIVVTLYAGKFQMLFCMLHSAVVLSSSVLLIFLTIFINHQTFLLVRFDLGILRSKEKSGLLHPLESLTVYLRPFSRCVVYAIYF